MSASFLFCNTPYCNVLLDSDSVTMCDFCRDDRVNECPGCGEQLSVSANGYCSLCWQERYGIDEKIDEQSEPDAEVPPEMSKAVGIKGSDVYDSTGSPLVDLSVALVRGASDVKIRDLLTKVVEVSVVDAFVLAFQTRDIRGGKGERKLFEIMLRFLYEVKPELAIGVLQLVPEYGCWGDLFAIDQAERPLIKEVLRLARDQLTKDVEQEKEGKSCSLCAKWAPREKSDPGMTRALAAALFPQELKLSRRLKAYRKLVSGLNHSIDTTEIKMCAKRFADIQPEKVPGVCLAKNMRAFLNETRGKTREIRHVDDPDRYACRQNFRNHMANAAMGSAKVNGAVTRYPHQIIKAIEDYNYAERQAPHTDSTELNALIAVWNGMVANAKALGGLGRTIAMCDFSGSMTQSGSLKSTPYWVSMAMGLLISEVTSDEFKDTFLTFDSYPSWHTLPQGNIVTRLASIGNISQGTSTDFQKAMDLVLATLKEKRCRPGQEPKDLIVITDMAWDMACGSNGISTYTDNSYRHVVKTAPWQTHIEMIREAFKRAGEDMWGAEGAWHPPRIVIWNVANVANVGAGDFHSKADEEGVIMLSGWSPSIFKILTSEGARVQTPGEAIRLQLDDERYDPVRARLAALM